MSDIHYQDRVRNAVSAANRFLETVDLYADACIEDQRLIDTAYPSPERAQMKRASMDLTRALAHVRRPM